MPQVLSDFNISDFGDDMCVVQKALHLPALAEYYGDDIPEPMAMEVEDGQLAIFWDCGGWPITFRLDPEDWSAR